MDLNRPIAIDPMYSFNNAIQDSIEAEAAYRLIDLGPVDTLDPQALAEALDLFFGTSPMSTPPSSTPPSPVLGPLELPQQLIDYELELDELFGTSPLSTPPSSSPPSPLPSPHTIPLPPAPAPTLEPAPSADRPPERNSNARRNRKKSHSNRCRKRGEVRSLQDKNTTVYSKTAKIITNTAITQTDYDTSRIPAASTGFIALSDKEERAERVHKTEELLAGGKFKLVPNDGRTQRAIVDKDGRAIAVVVGQPNDADWPSVHRSAFAALLSARKRCRFSKKMRMHRRGQFPALNTGISFGGGQQRPGNLQHREENAAELAALIDHLSFKRIAGYSSKALLSWAPKLHAFYRKELDDLLKSNPDLRRNFSNSVWTAAAFNFGPRTCSLRHRDFANLPFGWCSITSLGDFDPTKGGHLVLWELGLIIEFPPGTTILIPSAAISHSNTDIGKGETRCSFTQFSAGGLFRWSAHGYQKDDEYFRGMSTADRQRVAAENEARRKLGLSLFSTLDELKKMFGAPTCTT